MAEAAKSTATAFSVGDEAVTFGRSSKCTHVLSTSDTKLKRVHLRIHKDKAGTVWAENLGTTVYVNSVGFDAAGMLPLDPNDIITFRDREEKEFIFQYKSDASSTNQAFKREMDENENLTQVVMHSPAPNSTHTFGTPLTEFNTLTAGGAAAPVSSPVYVPAVEDLTFPEYPLPPADPVPKPLPAPPPLPDFAAIRAARGIPPPAPPPPSTAPKATGARPLPPPLPMFTLNKHPPAQPEAAAASAKPPAASAFSGADFQAELVAAVRRKQESLHIAPAAAQPEAPRPSRIPSLQALQQTTAGLRKVSPPPSRPVTPPFPAQLSPGWDTSPLESAGLTEPRAASPVPPAIPPVNGAPPAATPHAPIQHPHSGPSLVQAVAPSAAAVSFQQSALPLTPISAAPVTSAPVSNLSPTTATAPPAAPMSAQVMTPGVASVMLPPNASSAMASSSKSVARNIDVAPSKYDLAASQDTDALREELAQAYSRISHLELVISVLQSLVPGADHPDLLERPEAFVAGLRVRRMGAGVGKGLMHAQATPTPAATEMSASPATVETARSISFGKPEQTNVTADFAQQGICQEAPSSEPAALIDAPVWWHFLTTGWVRSVDAARQGHAHAHLVFKCGAHQASEEERHLLQVEQRASSTEAACTNTPTQMQGMCQEAPSTDPAALVGVPVWRHFLTTGWARAVIAAWLPDKATHTLAYNRGTSHEFQEEVHVLHPKDVLLSWRDPEALVPASPSPGKPWATSVQQLPADTEMSVSKQNPPTQASPCLFWNPANAASAVEIDGSPATSAVNTNDAPTPNPAFDTPQSERFASISFRTSTLHASQTPAAPNASQTPAAVGASQTPAPIPAGGFTPMQSIDLLADMLCTPMPTGCEAVLKLDDFLGPVRESLALKSPSMPVTMHACVAELAAFVEAHSDVVHESKRTPLIAALQQARSSSAPTASPAMRLQPLALPASTASNPTPANTPAGSAIKEREPSPITAAALMQCAGCAALPAVPGTPAGTPSPQIESTLAAQDASDTQKSPQQAEQLANSAPQAPAGEDIVAGKSGASWQALNAAVASNAMDVPKGLAAAEHGGISASNVGLLPHGTPMALQPFEFGGAPSPAPSASDGPQAMIIDGPTPVQVQLPELATEVPKNDDILMIKTTPMAVAPWEFGGTPAQSPAALQTAETMRSVLPSEQPHAAGAAPLALSPLEFGTSSPSVVAEPPIAVVQQTPLVLSPGEFGALPTKTTKQTPSPALATVGADPELTPLVIAPGEFVGTPATAKNAAPSPTAATGAASPGETPLVISPGAFGGTPAVSTHATSPPMTATGAAIAAATPLVIAPGKIGSTPAVSSHTASPPLAAARAANTETTPFVIVPGEFGGTPSTKSGAPSATRATGAITPDKTLMQQTPLIIEPAEFGDVGDGTPAGSSPAFETKAPTHAEQPPASAPTVLEAMGANAAGEQSPSLSSTSEASLQGKHPRVFGSTAGPEQSGSGSRGVKTSSNGQRSAEPPANASKEIPGSGSPSSPAAASAQAPAVQRTPQGSAKAPSALCDSSQPVPTGRSPRGTPLLHGSPLRFQSSAAKPKALASSPLASNENAAPLPPPDVPPEMREASSAGDGKDSSDAAAGAHDAPPAIAPARVTRAAARSASTASEHPKNTRTRKRKQPAAVTISEQADTDDGSDGETDAGTGSTLSTQRTRMGTARGRGTGRATRAANKRGGSDSGADIPDAEAEAEPQKHEPENKRTAGKRQQRTRCKASTTSEDTAPAPVDADSPDVKAEVHKDEGEGSEVPGKKRKVGKRQQRAQSEASVSVNTAAGAGPARRTRAAASASVSVVSEEAFSTGTVTSSGSKRATRSSSRSQSRLLGPKSKGVTKTKGSSATSKRSKPQKLHDSVDAELQAMLDSKYEPKLSVIREVGEENLASQASLPSTVASKQDTQMTASSPTTSVRTRRMRAATSC